MLLACFSIFDYEEYDYSMVGSEDDDEKCEERLYTRAYVVLTTGIHLNKLEDVRFVSAFIKDGKRYDHTVLTSLLLNLNDSAYPVVGWTDVWDDGLLTGPIMGVVLRDHDDLMMLKLSCPFDIRVSELPDSFMVF